MSYIGNTLPANFQSLPAVQRFNGNASTTAFTLAAAIANDQSILVSVDGVVQDSNAYSVSGTTLTFTAAPSAGTGNIFVNTISPVGSTITHPASDPLSASTGTFSGALSATTGTFTGNLASTSSGVITNSLITSSTNQYAEQLFQDGNAGYALQVRSDNAQSTGTGSFLINDRDTGSFPVVIKEGNASNTLVLSGSKVGIGTASPSETLTVTGNFNATTGVKSLGVYNNTTGTGANVVVDSAGGFARSTSSRRYKNTINDATHGLTELLTLRPVTYKGNNDGDTLFGGLIAEEVHDAGLTEFVTYNDNNEPDALAYGNMVSLCIKAIQELSAKNDDLKTKNDALEARITALESA